MTALTRLALPALTLRIRQLSGVLLLLFFALPAQAQTGRLEGNVLDANTKQALIGALVYIPNTTYNASVDVDGNFVMARVPVGEQTLTVSYLGYEEQSLAVTVTPGENAFLYIEAVPESFGLEQVTVSANLEGQQRALNQQRAADNVVNIISADLIARFPDLNVSEALQRVPGINIDRDNGEGGGVTVRGTPQNYTTIRINGEQIQDSGNSGGRTPGLTMFPVDQLGTIEVSKTLMPDQDGDAIGGSVDLSSPKARRPQLGLKAELGTGYNGLSDGFNAIGRLSVGKRFGVTEANKNGKFGILLSGSYYGTDNGEDRTESEWRPQDIEPENGEDSEAFLLYTHDLRGLTTQRTRSGLGASLDYQFNPTNFITGRVLYSALEEDEIRSRTRYRPRNGTYRSATFNEGGRVRKTFRDRTVNRYTTSINLNGTFAVGNLKITPGFAYSETERDEDGRRNQFELRGVDMNITEADTEAPQFTPAGDVSFRDPAAYERWDNYRIYNTLVSATTTTTKIDFEYPIKVGKNLLTLKTGYKRRTSEKTQDSDQNFFEYDGDTDGLFASFVADGLLTEDYLNGQVDFGPAISPDLVREFYEANSADFEANLEDKLEDETTFFYDAEETTDALYLMAKYRVGNLLLIGGLRNESVDVVYNAREYVEPEDEDAFARPSMGGSNYSFLLPNLQLKYELNRLTNLRLAYTTGYARPNFRDLVPSFQVDLEGEELSTGNPDLRPPSSTNLDLMFERYLGTVGILSGGLFYKRIEDFRFVRNLSIITGEEFDGAERYLDFEAEIADNGEEATVFGIELNAQTNLKFLPGALSGLGLYLNYTYTTSDAFTAERTDIRLPGQAPHTLNGALTYDLGGFSGRINVNFQDERLQSIGGDRGGVGENDIIRAARTQVDVNASYTFARRWRVYAEAINITNAAQIDFWGNSSRTASTAYFSWWSRVGVGYSF